MDLRLTSISELQIAFMKCAEDGIVERVTADALAQANGNASQNTYLWRDPDWTLAEARRASEMATNQASGRFGTLVSQPLLWGLPISVKDCFDLTGAPTSCGTNFYRDHNGIANQDSWLVEQLRKNGAVITGKTHLHPLAYGITGENPDFLDCLQPGNPGALTGGSSSGAAASILEGSAIAAIGTDTGGSIRVPAALCGLVGYRASIGRGNWRGGAHLAESFDTMGWLFRHLSDATVLSALFKLTQKAQPTRPFREPLKDLSLKPVSIAVVGDSFLDDAEPAVAAGFHSLMDELASLGLKSTTVDVDWWSDSREIFAPIQASEAARYHRGNFAHIDEGIRQRLEWGASLKDDEIANLRHRHETFRARMDTLLAQYQFLALPAAPVARLEAGADHSQTRTRLLRYTTPVSLAGMPAVSIPGIGSAFGSGVQLVAARDNDEALLRLVHQLGEARKKRNLSA